MICPRCGTWIDEGEPYCPGCLWDGSDEDDDDEEFYNEYNTSYNSSLSYSDTQEENPSNQHTKTYTHTINNDTQRIEDERPKNDNGSNPLTCCCVGIILLWILGVIGSLFGL